MTSIHHQISYICWTLLFSAKYYLAPKMLGRSELGWELWWGWGELGLGLGLVL